MNIETKMYVGEDGKHSVPTTISNMSQWAVHSVAVAMKTFGISQVTLVLETSGISPIATLQYEQREVPIPDDLNVIKVSILRDIVKVYMLRFGIQRIAVTLDDEEQRAMDAYWVEISRPPETVVELSIALPEVNDETS